MNRSELFKCLSVSNQEFVLLPNGQCRANVKIEKTNYSLCPLLVAANQKLGYNKLLYSITDIDEAKNILGMSDYDTDEIMNAADYANDCNPNIRKKLLKACRVNLSG